MIIFALLLESITKVIHFIDQLFISLNFFFFSKAFGFRSTGKKPILCHGVVFSGIPPTSGLYNVSLCDLHSQLDILLSANSESYSEVQKNQEVDSVDPVTIPRFII